LDQAAAAALEGTAVICALVNAVEQLAERNTALGALNRC
jgi:hypothetical protein